MNTSILHFIITWILVFIILKKVIAKEKKIYLFLSTISKLQVFNSRIKVKFFISFLVWFDLMNIVFLIFFSDHTKSYIITILNGIIYIWMNYRLNQTNKKIYCNCFEISNDNIQSYFILMTMICLSILALIINV